ncbi:uncharacterized protein CIMG_03958 [Coccidioides immitis RS]|uniref:Uncharacterized protein n=4 Tax=Coccidioides immitis TaxID=5501 RepID=J3KCG9_COCIM|nr:uncharacterized protein CIMG_03958 [Coccidioides immitis RS]KMP08210.1 hypothetical protein CIRG_07891 [Coccidioides immitis RMSCC 2394]KMU79511.1 hypothetical protein CISG_01929 [Coccidioides immitis RMSCC 3703]KMU89917.1 hypothetical protein CIHG_07600 [Coccidioides immitis H538.4]TPX22932.1 hypothetical protein DIZ76_014813 [Coccidioides immitis]EAS32934.3 hypothetical protein CIMG_03958 [Coccidioides immitis RS]
MGLVSRLLPLAMLFLFLAIIGFLGLVVYNIVMDVKAQTKKHMEKNNVMFSKDGVTVELKELNDEEYKDRTQSVLVDVWNHGALPDMKYHWRRKTPSNNHGK